MKGYDTILFDMDGTIVDSVLTVTKGIQLSLSKIGIVEEDLDKLKGFLGPPMIGCFMETYGLSFEQAGLAVEFTRKYIKANEMKETVLFPGVIELLDVLKTKYRLIIATARPIDQAQEILKHFGIDHYFVDVEASPSKGNEDVKSKIIQRVLNKHPYIDRNKTIMVGDRKNDLLGAMENSIHSIGVTYGCGTKEEIESANPNYIVQSIGQLKELLV